MKRLFISIVIVQVVLLVSTHTVAQFSEPTLRDTTTRIERIFSAFNTTTPGAVVRVSRNGKLLYEKAFGMADLEHHVINTPQSIFEAGSVSKQFTAAAALLLINEGKLSLKDDIRKHFPDLPDYGAPVTVEHLLHHTSGLRDWGVIAEFAGWPRGTRIYTAAHVKDIIWRQKQLNFIPGTEYNYSNSNYNMLVFLVEKISGKTLQQFTAEKFFRPFGMNNTKWRDNFREVIVNRSIAYSGSPGNYRQNMPFENTFGHGALLTTVADLDKWNQRWRTLELGREINELQRSAVTLASGQPISYAAGVVNERWNNLEEISHSGATAGYRAWLAYYPASGISVAVLSNYAGADPVSFGRQIAQIFLGEYKITPPVYTPTNADISQMRPLAGVYRALRGEDILEFVYTDSLRFKNSFHALIPTTDNRYFSRDGYLMSFMSVNGQQYLKWYGRGNDTMSYVRVIPYDTSIALSTYTGTFYSEEAESTVKLLIKDKWLQVFLAPDSYQILTPTYKDVFRWGYNLFEFERNAKKEITGFRVSGGRVRHLLYKKNIKKN